MSKIIESGCGNTTILAGDEVVNEIYVDDLAKIRIEELCKDEELGTFLRIAVMGGGCSGFQYLFGLDLELSEDDIVNDWGTGKVVVDDTSIEFMKGSTLHFIKEISGDYFQIENKLVRSECGCQNSFSI